MSLLELPAEVWAIVFEQLEFPKSTCVIHRSQVAAVRTATLQYEGGRSDGVANLPDFERSKWLEMRRYYNIDRSTRETAMRVKLSEKWFTSFENSSSAAYNDGSVWYQPSFHGSQAPIYIALNLYNIRPWDNTRGEVMNRAKNDFIDFAVDNPVLSTLRRLDLIVRVSREGQSIARRHVDVLVKCVNAEWDLIGIPGGVVQVFWEIMPEVAELDSHVLIEMMEEEAEDEFAWMS